MVGMTLLRRAGVIGLMPASGDPHGISHMHNDRHDVVTACRVNLEMMGMSSEDGDRHGTPHEHNGHHDIVAARRDDQHDVDKW